MNETDRMEGEYTKLWKCCVCGKIIPSAICLFIDGIWFDYCQECYQEILSQEGRDE